MNITTRPIIEVTEDDKAIMLGDKSIGKITYFCGNITAHISPFDAALALGEAESRDVDINSANIRTLIFGRGKTEEEAIQNIFQAEQLGRAAELKILAKLQTAIFGHEFGDIAESLQIETLKTQLDEADQEIKDLKERIKELEESDDDDPLFLRADDPEDGDLNLLEHIQDRLRMGHDLADIINDKFREHELVSPTLA